MQQREDSPPTVYVVAGRAGSGKSTLGRAIATLTGAVLLDQDVATNPLLGEIAALVGAGQDWDHPALRGRIRAARYQCLIDIAADNCVLGHSVVLVAPFTSERGDPRAWSLLAGQLIPARVVLIWVAVPPEIAAARRQLRNLARDRAVDPAAEPRPDPPPTVRYLAADGAAAPGCEAVRVVSALG